MSTPRQRDLLVALGLSREPGAALALASDATESELAKLTIWALANKAQVTVQSPVVVQVAGPTDSQVASALASLGQGFDPVGAAAAALVSANQHTDDELAALPGSEAGEFLSSSVAAVAGVPLSSTITVNVATLDLPAGDWDVAGIVKFGLTTVTATLFQHGISITTATLPSSDNFVEKPIALAGFVGTMSDCVPTVRLSLDAPASVFLVARITMSAGTAVAYGNIRATKAK